MNALEKFDPVIEQINQIKEQGNFLPDCSTKEGYQKSKRFVLDITTKARKALEARHKEVKAPFAQAVKDIDGKKNELMAILKEVEQPHQEAYKAIDQAEKLKKQQFESLLEGKIEELVAFRSDLHRLTASEIEERIGSCGEIDTSEGFYHRAIEAAKERSRSLEELELALEQKREAEQTARELAQLKKERAVDQAFDSVFSPLSDPLDIAQAEEAAAIGIVKASGCSDIQAAAIVDAIKENKIANLHFRES